MILAYRKQKDMQKAVDRTLGVTNNSIDTVDDLANTVNLISSVVQVDLNKK